MEWWQEIRWYPYQSYRHASWSRPDYLNLLSLGRSLLNGKSVGKIDCRGDDGRWTDVRWKKFKSVGYDWYFLVSKVRSLKLFRRVTKHE